MALQVVVVINLDWSISTWGNLVNMCNFYISSSPPLLLSSFMSYGRWAPSHTSKFLRDVWWMVLSCGIFLQVKVHMNQHPSCACDVWLFGLTTWVPILRSLWWRLVEVEHTDCWWISTEFIPRKERERTAIWNASQSWGTTNGKHWPKWSWCLHALLCISVVPLYKNPFSSDLLVR